MIRKLFFFTYVLNGEEIYENSDSYEDSKEGNMEEIEYLLNSEDEEGEIEKNIEEEEDTQPFMEDFKKETFKHTPDENKDEKKGDLFVGTPQNLKEIELEDNGDVVMDEVSFYCGIFTELIFSINQMKTYEEKVKEIKKLSNQFKAITNVDIFFKVIFSILENRRRLEVLGGNDKLLINIEPNLSFTIDNGIFWNENGKRYSLELTKEKEALFLDLVNMLSSLEEEEGNSPFFKIKKILRKIDLKSYIKKKTISSPINIPVSTPSVKNVGKKRKEKEKKKLDKKNKNEVKTSGKRKERDEKNKKEKIKKEIKKKKNVQKKTNKK